MLLGSSVLAYHEDNAHNILWSDLFVADVPMDDIGLGVHVKVNAMFSSYHPIYGSLPVAGSYCPH